MWQYVAICGNMWQYVRKYAKTCKQTSHPTKALIRTIYYTILHNITKKTPMRYSTDPRKQRKQQKYIAIFLLAFAILAAIVILQNIAKCW